MASWKRSSGAFQPRTGGALAMIGGMLFATKAAVTMNEEFAYNFHKFAKPQKDMFRAMCKEVRGNGGNDVDAASHFMAVMADSLSDPNEHASQIVAWLEKIRELAPRMTVRYATELDEAYGKIMGKLA